MAIVRWEPFRDMLTAQREFDRLFRGAFRPAAVGEEEASTRTWAPPVDIFENGDNLVLKAELPGINPDDVEVRVEDNTLYLKGERSSKRKSRSRATTALNVLMERLRAPSRCPTALTPTKSARSTRTAS